MRFITLLASMPLLAVAFRPSGSSLLLRRTNRAHRLVAHTLSSSEGGIVSFKAAKQDLLEQVASNTTRSTSFQAYVTRRRPMGSALTFLDLVSSDPDAREMQVLVDFLFLSLSFLLHGSKLFVCGVCIVSPLVSKCGPRCRQC